jgi:hypothetical protein
MRNEFVGDLPVELFCKIGDENEADKTWTMLISKEMTRFWLVRVDIQKVDEAIGVSCDFSFFL